MSGAESEVDAGAPAAGRRGWRRLFDPRLVLGLGVTAVALWFAFRDVDWPALGSDLAAANLWVLILPSFLGYLWTIDIRARRWHYLASGVGDFSYGPLFRGTAVGFMVNNIFPLRVGEFARAWQLSRETGKPAPAIFGSVVLERVVDSVCVLGVAAVVLGTRLEQEQPGALRILVALAVAPVAVVVALRAWPGPLLGLAERIFRAVLPDGLATRLDGLLRQIAAGLAGLRSWGDFGWVLFHSFMLWGVASVGPFWAALVAVGIDLGGPAQMLNASLTLLACIAVAVALPSAPGFFGPYHAACIFALTPYGVSKEQALALGTLAHLAFWLSFIAIGAAALRAGGSSLGDTLAQAEAGAEAADEPPAGGA